MEKMALPKLLQKWLHTDDFKSTSDQSRKTSML